MLFLLVGIDSLARDLHISTFQIVGTIIVGVAFIVMVMPEKLVSVNIRQRIRGQDPKTTDDSLYRLRQGFPESSSEAVDSGRVFNNDGNSILPAYEMTLKADEDLFENQGLFLNDTETQVNAL